MNTEIKKAWLKYLAVLQNTTAANYDTACHAAYEAYIGTLTDLKDDSTIKPETYTLFDNIAKNYLNLYQIKSLVIH